MRWALDCDEVVKMILMLPETSTGGVMAVDDHTNTGGVELKIAAEGAGLADEVGTALAQDGVQAVTPAEVAAPGRRGTMAC